MLRKLIRHEFKATGRIFLLLYAALAVSTLLGKVMINLEIFDGPLEIVGGILTFAYSMFMIAMLVGTGIFLFVRYYRNMFSDEGYLMFTLPVKPAMLFHAKLIVSVIWQLLNGFFTVLAILVLVLDKAALSEMAAGFPEAVAEFEKILHIGFGLFMFYIIAGALLAVIFQMVLVFTSINIGQLFGKHRIAGAVVTWLAISTILQIISQVLFMVIGFNAYDNPAFITGFYRTVIPAGLMISTFACGVLYAVSIVIVNRKVNLE